MINKEEIISRLSQIITKIKDTKYVASDINERLALARMDVANLRALLLDAKDAATADMYAEKLKTAQIEYMRILKIAQSRKRAV